MGRPKITRYATKKEEKAAKREVTNAVKALLRAKEYKNALDLAFTCNWPWSVFKNAARGEYNALTYMRKICGVKGYGYWYFGCCARCGWMRRPRRDVNSAAITAHNKRCMEPVYSAVEALPKQIQNYIRVLPGPAQCKTFWARP